MEADNFLWNAFSQTGSIEAYLLYKKSYEESNEKKEEAQCRVLPQEEL